MTGSAVGASPSCLDCNLHSLCIAEGLDARDLDQLSGMVSSRRRVKRGASLFNTGDRFEAIFPIRFGSFKSRVVSAEGREQIVGFPMRGDLLGFDAVGTGRFCSDAVALEDSEVCVVPFAELEAIGRRFPPLQQRVHRVFSREIVRDRSQMMMLGTMRAEQRVAVFLLDLSERLEVRGFSASEILLRMTREEIGNYLALKLETVSRALSKMQEAGIVRVAQKQTTILDLALLRELAGVDCAVRASH